MRRLICFSCSLFLICSFFEIQSERESLQGQSLSGTPFTLYEKTASFDSVQTATASEEKSLGGRYSTERRGIGTGGGEASPKNLTTVPNVGRYSAENRGVGVDG
jgi:hypothetical protein